MLRQSHQVLKPTFARDIGLFMARCFHKRENESIFQSAKMAVLPARPKRININVTAMQRNWLILIVFDFMAVEQRSKKQDQLLTGIGHGIWDSKHLLQTVH
jgi:hypothetical protein